MIEEPKDEPSFCPFIKGKCKKESCMLFIEKHTHLEEGGDCSIFIIANRFDEGIKMEEPPEDGPY